ncbi:MAG: flagellar biosynthesis repressor FlbT, partial [Alphaproteobacteria bacterium]
MLVDPPVRVVAFHTFKRMIAALLGTFSNSQMLKELKLVDEMVCNDRIFEALKTIRSLYALEAQIMSGTTDTAIPSQSSQPVRPEAIA